MECKHALKRGRARSFLSKRPDADLFTRRRMHEDERAQGMPGRTPGSVDYAERLLWMREVRTQIRERRLEARVCECGDGGHDTGHGVCMCGGVIKT